MGTARFHFGSHTNLYIMGFASQSLGESEHDFFKLLWQVSHIEVVKLLHHFYLFNDDKALVFFITTLANVPNTLHFKEAWRAVRTRSFQSEKKGEVREGHTSPAFTGHFPGCAL